MRRAAERRGGGGALSPLLLVLVALLALAAAPRLVSAVTDAADVSAINGLYVSLGSPTLPGWTGNGGDPCGELWQGVVCTGSTITGITMNAANLGGQLGSLGNFTSIITIDLSNNNIGGAIPEDLPVTLQSFFLSANQLTGSIPSSLSKLENLTAMSVNGNHLNGDLPDAFDSLNRLVNLDISSNNMTGVLPSSMKSLASLTTLHMQDNQLSGTLNVLQDLPLKDLNIENNQFSGPVPASLLNIPNFKVEPQIKPPPVQQRDDVKKGQSEALDRRGRELSSSAADSFREENVIRESRIGKVYLAELPDGKLLEVMKIDNANGRISVDDFLEGVEFISGIKHPNILELVGYCAEYGQRLLVYHHFSRRTLDDALHDREDTGSALSWNARLQVALGSGKALEYLHERLQPPTVHQNFEPANVLLDEKFSLSGRMRALLHYEAPEFLDSGDISARGDVYSFGVVMLELLTGRKPYDSSRPRHEQHLVRWASSQLHDIESLSKMVDPSIRGQCSEKALSRFVDIISRCIQRQPEFRPPMSEIVQDLARLVNAAGEESE
nr:unnamed protein product [Digitaria exilis]